jgi:hypothetical protein
MHASRSSPGVLAWLFGGVLLAFFLYLIIGVGRFETSVPDHDAVAVCIGKYQSTTGMITVGIGDLYGLNGFCYDTIGSQLKIDQEKIRRDNFVFQRNENVVLLYMVVLVTISGVVLAGVQLLASYKLAVLGRGELAGGGSEINYSAHSISFKSSVIGLTILAMSFAFFLVFIMYVYDMRDMSSAAESRPVAQSFSPAQPPTNLLPVLTPLDQPRAAEGAPSSTTGVSTEPSSASNAAERP